MIQDEGYRNYPYKDTKGIVTIGIGYNLEANGLPDDIIEELYRRALTQVILRLDANIPWWRNLSPARQRVMINMCYNMGWCNEKRTRGLCTFVNTLEHIKNGEYEQAADHMLRSKWARDVGPERSGRLSEMMRLG